MNFTLHWRPLAAALCTGVIATTVLRAEPDIATAPTGYQSLTIRANADTVVSFAMQRAPVFSGVVHVAGSSSLQARRTNRQGLLVSPAWAENRFHDTDA